MTPIAEAASILATATPSSISSGGMSKPVMAAVISGPIVAVALIGLGIMMFRRRVGGGRRNRASMPYDEEFESLKKKHEEKFGVGHNY